MSPVSASVLLAAVLAFGAASNWASGGTDGGGGGIPFCERVPDGGQCPSGWTLTGNCAAGGGGPGCTPPPCTPPAPYCVDLPAACAGTPSCTCLPANVCTQNGGSGGCQFLNASGVTCASA